jgi:hypothetical protein
LAARFAAARLCAGLLCAMSWSPALAALDGRLFGSPLTRCVARKIEWHSAQDQSSSSGMASPNSF